MSCRCALDSLRLFIKSVSQVDLSTSTTFKVASRSPIRSFRSTTTVTGRCLPQRTYSTTAASGRLVSLDAPSDDEPSKSLRTSRQSGYATGNADSGFVEFSPDAVDAIAAELAPQRHPQHREAPLGNYETPLKSLLKDLPRKQPKPPATAASKTTIRRTKIANESFTLHFSNPRRTDSDSKSTKLASPPKPQEDWIPPTREHWQIDKEALSKKFPGGWNPIRRLSPDAMAGIRALHAQMPERYTTEALSQEFGVTAEAVRRILKSSWSPSPEEETDRQRRWLKRGELVWSRYADLGVKPPKAWRERGIGKGKPEWLVQKRERARRQQEPRIVPALITTSRRSLHKEGGNQH